jgi:hypothetical protein
MKLISQNPERYSKQGSNWVISAAKAVTPITLPIGVPLQNLKPLIEANGIIVKVGEMYLCSLTTLNLIKQSNNPHYDIVQNGTLKVKDKDVVIGKTIKIIELKEFSNSSIEIGNGTGYKLSDLCDSVLLNFVEPTWNYTPANGRTNDIAITADVNFIETKLKFDPKIELITWLKQLLNKKKVRIL